ncbi:MAG: TetR family transcriptional regulator [Beggiatoa sp. IS2]|nr:MAG: TetR family transcriptional regulator [Beggiatoa sp. IS2]
MKTSERILQTSLQLFNEYGEPNITTNHIANEMDISPGNLYYHFRNKDEIVYLLFLQFEEQITAVLETPQSRNPTMDDMWLYLHLAFENIWQYRFLYRDLNNLLSRNKKLQSRFRRILDRKAQTAITICQGLVETGIMQATPDEIETLANNVTIIATYWLNFQSIRSKQEGADGHSFSLGVYHVMALVAPFLKENARQFLYKLGRDYLS